MTHPRSITTNLKFTYADQRRKLGGLLKYFQHRDDKDGRGHIPQIDEDGRRVPRWVDRGLGSSHGRILQQIGGMATDTLKRNVGSRLMVVGPEVGLMHAIPEDRRGVVLGELTEATMEGWFERMNLPTPEFSYVLHESEPSDERPDGRLKDDSQGLSYLHAHVVIAPTVPGLVQDREGYKVYEKQIGWLHEAGREAMEVIWERELGVERYAELQAELDERVRYQQQLDRDHDREAAVEHEPPPMLDRTVPEPPAIPPPEIDMDMELGE